MRRIPRELLYITLDDLPSAARHALLPLLADLPRVPTADDSAVLVGPSDVTLPALAVLARHLVQGLRDHNLTIAHDRARLRAERRKLLFFDAPTALADTRAQHESVVCVADLTTACVALVEQRRAAGLASFVTARSSLPGLAGWRQLDFARGTIDDYGQDQAHRHLDAGR
jgi:hypothetical protein